MNRAHQCSGSATGPLIVFEPCNNVTTRGQVSLLSNPIISQKDWYTPPPEWKHHKKWYPSVLIHADSLVLPTPTSNYILSRLSQFVLTKPHYLSELVFPDIHRNAMVFKPYHMMWNEWGLEEVYALLGAGHFQVCFFNWEAISSSFHTSTFATFHTIWMGKKQVQDMKQITGWTKTPALQQRCPLAEGNGPFPSARPTLQLCHPSDSNIVSR